MDPAMLFVKYLVHPTVAQPSKRAKDIKGQRQIWAINIAPFLASSRPI